MFTSVGAKFRVYRYNTLKQIRNPVQFFENKLRSVGSSIFAFKDSLSIVSYVPKTNKAVILVSSSCSEYKYRNSKARDNNGL